MSSRILDQPCDRFADTTHLNRLNSPVRARQNQFLDLSGGNIRSPGEIHDLALVLQEIEMPLPIVPNHENIHIVRCHIRRLLFPIFFRNHQIDKSQREYVLREQMRAIKSELGEEGSVMSDADELRQKLEAIDVSDEVREKAEKEISRMERLSMGSPELGVIMSYVETIIDLPWNKKTEDNLDLKHARAILDEDHFGLEKVKDRIIEFIAVLEHIPAC